MRRPTPRPASGRAALAGAVVACCLVAGCTGDGVEEPSCVGSSTPSASDATEPAETPAVVTAARNGKVTGKIGKSDRKDVVDRVARVVDEWLEAAYVGGDYPRDPSAYDESAWPGFTQGAAQTAVADKDLMSNADIADRIDALTVRRREITVDVLAVGRTARAATARVKLAFRTEGVDGGFERKVTVTGRVFLTKKDGSWKVFGYDVAKARA
jgi:hypothetical protein